MSAIVMFIRALLSSGGNVRAKYSDVHSRDELEAFERRRALFSGRGIICLGGGPGPTAHSESTREPDRLRGLACLPGLNGAWRVDDGRIRP